jgi:tyrosyl-tRNA synthetase
VRRVEGGQAYALTAPLITKSDGSKFGKSEVGNIWIDKARTSAYTFYQYWINTADADAGRYLRIFTLMDREQIEALEAEHAENSGARIMQKALAADMTRRVHSEQDLATAVAASALLFGKSSEEDLRSLPPAEILSVFEGVPRRIVDREALAEGISVIELLAGGETPFLASNSDARRSLKENAISLNKTKLQGDRLVTTADLIGDEFLVLQRGKKNYFTVRVS